MIKQRFYEAVEALQKEIIASQDSVIKETAMLCAEAIKEGHSIHLYDTGHIIDAELRNRAGGFNLLRAFKYNLNVDSLARKQDGEKERSQEGLAEYALRLGNVYPGDVLFIGSVSGVSSAVVDLAQSAMAMGVKVAAITSVTYSKELSSLHSSGKKLYEVNDVLIDNCAPFGDAMLAIEGIERPFIPASGLSAAFIMWAIMADLLEELLAMGIKPGVLGSVNYPPNVQYNIDLEDLYKEKGY